MLYYYSPYMAGLFTVPCIYFYKSKSDEVEIAKEASQFPNTFWENYDLTVQPVITYIYLGYAYCFF